MHKKWELGYESDAVDPPRIKIIKTVSSGNPFCFEAC